MKIKFLIISSLLIVSFITTSCINDEVFVGPAKIANVTGTPLAPQSTESVVVSAKITDLKGISSVKLNYKPTGVTAFTIVDMVVGENFIYSATIPAFAKDIKVEYYVEVLNSDNLKSVYPANAPTALASYTVGASNLVKLFVNEVFPDGTKDATDPDWIEIYNDSEIPVNLAGYYLYDEGIKTSLSTASPKAKRVLGSIEIPAKGFTVIPTEYNGETVTFGLSTGGDGAYLEDPNGILVASLDFNTIVTTGKKSYGRKPDGSSTLVLFNTASKGSSNNNAN